VNFQHAEMEYASSFSEIFRFSFADLRSQDWEKYESYTFQILKVRYEANKAKTSVILVSFGNIHFYTYRLRRPNRQEYYCPSLRNRSKCDPSPKNE
jgi:hypothetical protein